nr:hypothetical protein [Rhodococcus sp. (in: high G+C Gram-positive bacteria)]
MAMGDEIRRKQASEAYAAESRAQAAGKAFDRLCKVIDGAIPEFVATLQEFGINPEFTLGFMEYASRAQVPITRPEEVYQSTIWIAVFPNGKWDWTGSPPARTIYEHLHGRGQAGAISDADLRMVLMRRAEWYLNVRPAR